MRLNASASHPQSIHLSRRARELEFEAGEHLASRAGRELLSIKERIIVFCSWLIAASCAAEHECQQGRSQLAIRDLVALGQCGNFEDRLFFANCLDFIDFFDIHGFVKASQLSGLGLAASLKTKMAPGMLKLEFQRCQSVSPSRLRRLCSLA